LLGYSRCSFAENYECSFYLQHPSGLQRLRLCLYYHRCHIKDGRERGDLIRTILLRQGLSSIDELVVVDEVVSSPAQRSLFTATQAALVCIREAGQDEVAILQCEMVPQLFSQSAFDESGSVGDRVGETDESLAINSVVYSIDPAGAEVVPVDDAVLVGECPDSLQLSHLCITSREQIMERVLAVALLFFLHPALLAGPLYVLENVLDLLRSERLTVAVGSGERRDDSSVIFLGCEMLV